MQVRSFRSVTLVLPACELMGEGSAGQARRYDRRIAGDITTKATASSQPIMRLRGAGVDVEVRRVVRAVVGLGLAALAALVIVLVVAGVEKNAEITRLRHHGVVVEATVSACRGLLGGSGSNAAGYDCSGTFSLDGRRYNEALPGNSLRAPGSSLRVVTVPGDPGLVSTVGAVATGRTTLRVFIAPTIGFVILGLSVAVVLERRAGQRVAQPTRD
jgi:hypothetical protein